ncbi:MAG: glucose-1-phosphate adenylyltransferase subunit GlgD [Lachnospiraceae bacterium]|nr:glucose-1-phosphate adenylyltransferase subunit GlgD [Lachnospiraceae bacterium]
MVNSNKSALGIIFPNHYDALVPELVSIRNMASIPFASRYRMIDFILSSMVNCNINNICVPVNTNYHSLMDHLGTGREWDLVRKNGGLHIFPPYAEKSNKVYNGRIGTLANILPFLREQKERFVIMADSSIAVNFDFSKMIDEHIESGADVSIAYHEEELPEYLMRTQDNSRGFHYTFTIDKGRINHIYVNPRVTGVQNYSMNIYVLERELLINMVNTTFVRGLEHFNRDVLMNQLSWRNVHAFKFDGYAARITGMKSYFDENLKLLDDYNLDALFSGAPIYTKIRDDNPTRYISGAKVSNVICADGCVIEGEVENSVLFRGVRVEKGAVVKNCVLMQDTVVGAGAHIEYVITDKNVKFGAGKEMKGTDSFPVNVAKGHTV